MIMWKDVSFSYSEQEMGSLNGVNLSVSEGECVLFCGRSGCGKTTMLRQINGLVPNFFLGEREGVVTLEGQEAAELPMYRLAEKVGSVFQNPRTQFFNVDTDSEIAFGIENEALPPEELEKRVEQTAKDLHIEHLRGRSIFALSGGEKQKVAFASVYAMNPKVYLLDEPSSNLDMDSIEELRGYLQTIKKQGKTILIAEHRLYYLTDIVDRVVYLEKGRIAGNCGDEVIKLEDVTIRYQKNIVLEHINLQASRGEIIAVTGHNGAGKTTFSRVICGLHKECDGQFLWEGRPISEKERRKKSYLVMQDVGYELFAESVEEECVFGIRNPDKELARQTIRGLGLWEYRERHPNTLSGGQKQRLAVAVSMVCGKEILVFDEPTSGLDYDSMAQVAVLLERLAGQGKIIFVVTHDYELICRVCTRLLYFAEREMKEELEIIAQNEIKIRALFGVEDDVKG